jgi:hypothetical protein
MQHADEMRLLAEGLPEVPAQHFQMCLWTKGKLSINTPECGSAGCAMGWFPILVPQNQLMKAKDRYPNYMNTTTYHAIALYFEIDHNEAVRLFSHESYLKQGGMPTPVEVSNRILFFLQSKGEYGG